MVKKTLLSLAVATALVSITGCNVSTTDRHENKIVANNPPVATMPEVSNFYPHFAPENQDVPVATDFLFASASSSDGTADTKVTEETFPVTTAINKLAGFSTTAPIYIKFSDEIDPGSLVVGGVLPQVYLIQLHNTETLGVPVDSLDLTDIVKQATIAGSPAGPIAGALEYGVDFEADAVDLGSGRKDTLRILLKKPLEPKTKYIVALTDGITSVDGEASSGSSTFVLASGNAKLPSAALEPVRTAVQGWSEIAGGAIAQGTSGALTQENLILTYAFTTDGSLDDIKQYAAPGLFVKNNLTVAQAEAMTDKAAGTEDAVAKGMVAAMSGLGITTVELAKAHSAYPVQLFGAIAKADLGGATLTEAAAAPTPRIVELVRPAAVDAAIAEEFGAPGLAASPDTLLALAAGGMPTGAGDTTTRYIQGSIQLPDFLGAATKTDMGLAAQNPQAAVAQAWRADHNWEANTNVGAILNGALEQPGAFPPKDVDGVSTNVTYRYPFPQPIGTNTAPFLLTLPSDTAGDCVGEAPFKTVIFVHGITSNRTASAIYAAQMAAQCIATVAIDLPLHGVAPADGALTMLSMSTADAAATSSPWAAVSAGAMSDPAMGGVAPIAEVSERHGNIWQNENSMRVDMDYTAAKGDSGSAFINLQNFGRTHDNLRQAVTDLLNLNASLVKINEALAADTELTGVSADRGTLDLNNVFVAGHSLGGIVASAFVAANNDPQVQAFASTYNPANGDFVAGLPKIQGLIIANSGGQLTKLLENSPAFAPAIVGGLAANGTMQGSENFEKFLYVFQATLDGVDPANTVSQLGDLPVQLFTVDGGLATGTMTAMPDNTVPVFDYFADENTNPFRTAVEAGIIKLPNAGVPTAKSALAGTQAIKSAELPELKESTYTVANHSTFADAGSSMPTSTPEEGAAALQANANFVDMVTKSITLINGGGATADAK